ncbi:hypothetical protein NM688_g5652 [Phlebia brevispora]|uniref:Uncharacterized protein n=1 Tax=Phlebia brevispora TaxID=194682 RepID=A0ACC1SS01_9APHY|nr:hypothetical protein NM688_g5652 [Phlebia brevispora]
MNLIPLAQAQQDKTIRYHGVANENEDEEYPEVDEKMFKTELIPLWEAQTRPDIIYRGKNPLHAVIVSEDQVAPEFQPPFSELMAQHDLPPGDDDKLPSLVAFPRAEAVNSDTHVVIAVPFGDGTVKRTRSGLDTQDLLLRLSLPGLIPLVPSVFPYLWCRKGNDARAVVLAFPLGDHSLCRRLSLDPGGAKDVTRAQWYGHFSRTIPLFSCRLACITARLVRVLRPVTDFLSSQQRLSALFSAFFLSDIPVYCTHSRLPTIAVSSPTAGSITSFSLFVFRVPSLVPSVCRLPVPIPASPFRRFITHPRSSSLTGHAQTWDNVGKCGRAARSGQLCCAIASANIAPTLSMWRSRRRTPSMPLPYSLHGFDDATSSSDHYVFLSTSVCHCPTPGFFAAISHERKRSSRPFIRGLRHSHSDAAVPCAKGRLVDCGEEHA